MNITIRILSFIGVFFASYVQSTLDTPNLIKYAMWFMCGAIFNSLLLAIFKTGKKVKDS